MRLIDFGNKILINPDHVTSIREEIDRDSYNVAQVGYASFLRNARHLSPESRAALEEATPEVYKTAPQYADFKRVLIKTSNNEFFFVNHSLEDVKRYLIDPALTTPVVREDE